MNFSEISGGHVLLIGFAALWVYVVVEMALLKVGIGSYRPQISQNFLEEVEARIAARTVENYSRLFRQDLIGVWSHDVGTFSQVHNEVWTFGADGSGEIVVLQPFGGERERAQLCRWRRVGDFAIGLRLTRGFGAKMDEDEGENRFETVRYEFRPHLSDCGETPALFEVRRNGFWLSAEPLSPHQLSKTQTERNAVRGA